jgi:hypothetical protein
VYPIVGLTRLPGTALRQMNAQAEGTAGLSVEMGIEPAVSIILHQRWQREDM